MKISIIIAGMLGLSSSIIHAQPGSQRNNRDHRQVYYVGKRYSSIPRSSVIITYRNNKYHYADGFFYRSHGAYFSLIMPPVGIFINILPKGYKTVRYPGGYCYYYNGIYYQQYDNRYQVIDAPVDAEIPELFQDAKAVVINNERLYEINGTYYKEEVNSAGDITYRIVGIAGELGNTLTSLHIGDIVQRLPEGCKTIILSNKKLYVSPSNLYFEEVTQQNAIAYKVVGNEVN